MIRLLHLSDVHFGAVNDRLPGPIVALAHDLRPDATVISGDLTQRARPAQFAAARAFVDLLPGPVLCVPGNHDMPLWNLGLRLLAPFARYRRAIGPELEPTLALPGAIIQGVNTANPFVWKSGQLGRSSAKRLTTAFAAAPPDVMRIAVLHHAPVPAADGTPADMADPAAVLGALALAGTDIVLSGHTHMPHAGFAETAAGVLFLQVGTAISTRLKTDTNDFALIEIGADTVTQHAWLARQDEGFVQSAKARFLKSSTGWRALPDAV
ncbi:metallophosphoesterase [Tabrizicola sp.]|uniref:metallophosphoesterase family protein n=1 Tax=Tabrizicola sp. TaxID=2005166 RepID=UPI0027329EFB|nr:metallophosphoesterase [Tabrizicola sp.]MDP3195708.1 metallophosphoesterase [Tabrizicola sp.]